MKTLELVTFRTAGTDAARFLDANAEVNDWLKKQPGFLARHLAHKDDDSWVDIVLWQDNDAAQKAAAKLMEEMAHCEAMVAIDPASIAMSHAGIRMSVA